MIVQRGVAVRQMQQQQRGARSPRQHRPGPRLKISQAVTYPSVTVRAAMNSANITLSRLLPPAQAVWSQVTKCQDSSLSCPPRSTPSSGCRTARRSTQRR